MGQPVTDPARMTGRGREAHNSSWHRDATMVLMSMHVREREAGVWLRRWELFAKSRAVCRRAREAGSRVIAANYMA